MLDERPPTVRNNGVRAGIPAVTSCSRRGGWVGRGGAGVGWGGVGWGVDNGECERSGYWLLQETCVGRSLGRKACHNKFPLQNVAACAGWRRHGGVSSFKTRIGPAEKRLKMSSGH